MCILENASGEFMKQWPTVTARAKRTRDKIEGQCPQYVMRIHASITAVSVAFLKSFKHSSQTPFHLFHFLR